MDIHSELCNSHCSYSQGLPLAKVAVLENVMGFRAVADQVWDFLDKNCPGYFSL